MTFSVFKMGHFSQMLLFFLMMVSVCMASPQPKHLCQYDEMRKGEPTLHVIQNLPTAAHPKAEMVSVVSETDWKPIRILVSMNQMNDGDQQCKREMQRKKDEYGNDYGCTKHDILTVQSKKDIKRVVYSAVKVHSSRLKVIPVKNKFTLPHFHNGFCSRLLIPEDHHQKGVSGADMVLYVSASLFSLGTSYGYGFPCAIEKLHHRPLVGGLLLNIKRIIATDYTVRALAHEIAHALGFDHEIIKMKNLIHPKLKVRGKDKVNEFRGDKVIEKVKHHYSCSSATGMEFEDEVKVSKTAKLGSLWESRNAKDELMAGVVRKGFYTYFTLAFFEDLGFYKANYSKAEHMDWGYKAGCEFLTKPCIEDGKSNFPSMFCTEPESKALFCTPGGRTMGNCVGLVSDKITSYPSYFHYFSDKKMTGVSYLLMDQCPYIEDEKGADCRHKEGSHLPGKKGPKSWCLRRTKDETKSTPEGHRGVCAEASDSSNDPEYIFNDNGTKAACDSASLPLTAPAPFHGMKLNCISSEVLTRKSIQKSISFLASDTDVHKISDALQFVVAEGSQHVLEMDPNATKSNADNSVPQDYKPPQENNTLQDEEEAQEEREEEEKQDDDEVSRAITEIEKVNASTNNGENVVKEVKEKKKAGKMITLNIGMDSAFMMSAKFTLLLIAIFAVN